MNKTTDGQKASVHKADEERIKDFDFVKSCYAIKSAPDVPAEQAAAHNALYAVVNSLYQVGRVNGMSWGEIFATSKDAIRDLWNREIALARQERESKQDSKENEA
jgi:hypothetical protein